ncbi:hypothetical protein POTOM_059881 [Populus tomentosa]|uniref:Uncharacterized protein n=1 Tax=Populus tomentosa TaxID=118781 RepID=A0A8X8C2D4_POPTO|nr:hypothetical protein POTOM_059881 [Populus tomentosa]
MQASLRSEAEKQKKLSVQWSFVQKEIAVLKEKGEKEHRIQILEKTVERLERVEKGERGSSGPRNQASDSEKAVLDSYKNVEAGYLWIHLSTTIVLTLANKCQPMYQLSRNFERVALSVSSELGAVVQSVENPLISDASATVLLAVPSQATIVSSVAPHAHLPTKMAEEKERKVPVPKPSVETRKTGRKLVRPRLVRPEEPPSDVEMSEVDGSTSVAKLAPASESETQHNITLFSQPIARKRLASSSSDLNEQPLNQGETSSDVPPPVLKRPKVVEESAVADLSQGEEEAVAEKEEVETSGEKAEPPKESEQLDDTTQVEPENETNEVAEEILDKPSESGMEIYDGSKDQATAEDSNNCLGRSPETGEVLPDTTPVASPARIDDEAMVPVGMESGEINSPEMITDEKNDEGDIVEEIGEGSDKSNEGGDQIAVETDQSPEAASVAGERTTATANTEMDASKQASSSGADAEEVRQVSPASNTSTVVNLAERARQRAMLRQGGSGASAVLSPPSARGRGRVLRGRIARGARGGRGQTPGQQG